MSGHTTSTRTLVIALAANLGIAVSKFVAAAITGSSAMLTEGVHSVVDSTNQLLLMWGRRAAKRPPDAPSVRLWARALFLELRRRRPGLRAGRRRVGLRGHHPHPASRAGGLAADRVRRAAGRLPARRLVHGRGLPGIQEAKGDLGWFQAVRQSKDPPAFIVLLENGAAMAGILAAAIGLLLSQLTGNPFFDGAASVIIGIILGFTAALLAYELKGLLIGESADPELVENLRELACDQSGVVGVGYVLTLHSSPDQITVMMNVDFRDDMLAGEVERVVCRIEEEARERWPAVRRLFVRPMQGAAKQLESRSAAMRRRCFAPD